MRTAKKVKLNETAIQEVPQTIIVSFTDHTGKSFGQFQFNTSAGPTEFQQVLDTLATKQTQDEYNFFHQTKQIKHKLSSFFQQISYNNFQATFDIICYPISNVKVRPVTRATSSLYGHTEAVLSLSFSPDSQNLASGSGDGSVRLWDIQTQTPFKEIPANNWIMIVQWSPCSSKFAYADKNGKIIIYHLQDQHQVQLNGHTKWITSLAWQPLHLNAECNKLVSGSKDFMIRLWNTQTGICQRSFGHHTKCITKVLWSGGNEIYSASQDQHINCFDGNGNFLRQLKKHSHWINTMSLSTQHVLRRGYFQLGKDCSKIQNKKEHALKLYQKAIQHHGQRLVTGSDDFTLMLFILPDKNPKTHMVGHGKPVNYVQFSPDGRYIASGSFDKKVKLWDGYTGQFMYTFLGHVGPVYLLVWSADSRFMISGSQDSTLKLWDIKTRKLMNDLPGHADQIYALDWSLDGRLVASGGKDRQVKLWAH